MSNENRTVPLHDYFEYIIENKLNDCEPIHILNNNFKQTRVYKNTVIDFENYLIFKYLSKNEINSIDNLQHVIGIMSYYSKYKIIIQRPQLYDFWTIDLKFLEGMSDKYLDHLKKLFK